MTSDVKYFMTRVSKNVPEQAFGGKVLTRGRKNKPKSRDNS
jgi:hypothetical protein